jgi:hypothetical protein
MPANAIVDCTRSFPAKSKAEYLGYARATYNRMLLVMATSPSNMIAAPRAETTQWMEVCEVEKAEQAICGQCNSDGDR